MAAIYLDCKACLSRYRVEKLDPVMTVTNQFHCPSCGASVGWSQDIALDYWYVLAEDFGLKPCQESADLIQQIYKDWDRIEFPNFRKYIEALKAKKEEPVDTAAAT